MLKGRIHSIESFGTVDGPGVRYVVFLQGCPLRCQYCHNPDTWDTGEGKVMTAEEILCGYDRVKSFLSNGGLTVSGGEPLLQMAFVTELMTLAKQRGIHTCIDTSGITFSEKEEVIRQFDRLLEVTDLFLLDVKHIDNEAHEKLTGKSNQNVLRFAQYLSDQKKDVWIRHVVVPGITYDTRALKELGYFLGGLSNIRALDVLPYHTMGEVKYQAMGLEYPLKKLEALEKQEAVQARNRILEGIREKRADKRKEKS